MSKKQHPDLFDRTDLTDLTDGFDDDEYAQQFIAAAGLRRRNEVPAAVVEKITAAAQEEWQARWANKTPQENQVVTPFPGAGRNNERAELPVWRWLALAATVLVTLSAGAWWWLGSPDDAGIAIAERLIGGVMVAASSEQTTTALQAGASLEPGTWIETAADGSVALRLGDGVSLRVDGGSRFRLASSEQVELTKGAIYVDTGHTEAGGGEGTGLAAHRLTVLTPLGAAWDLGTQFEVRLTAEGEMKIRVREGTVEAESQDHHFRAGVGDQLLVHADGTATTTSIGVSGEGWQWIVEIAPSIDIDGVSVGELLDWVGRETGWQIAFANPALEASARQAILRGGVEGDLRPDRAAQDLLPTAGFEATLVDGTLEITSLQ